PRGLLLGRGQAQGVPADHHLPGHAQGRAAALEVRLRRDVPVAVEEGDGQADPAHAARRAGRGPAPSGRGRARAGGQGRRHPRRRLPVRRAGQGPRLRAARAQRAVARGHRRAADRPGDPREAHRREARPAVMGFPQVPEGFRSGFACFVGRPNAGKSTLTNALVGQKVAITSSRPQTTRHAIRGILHRPDAQLVVVDTPGLHKPRTLLGSRLNDVVRETWAEVDVVGFCVPADQPVGRGDRFIAGELRSVAGRTPVLGIVTKTDLARPEQIAERLTQLAELMDFAEIVPCSAVDGFQVDLLADLLVARLPEGPPLYPDGELTDEPEETLVAELIREAALEGVRDELPHSIAVVIEEMTPREGRDDLLDVHASIYVERPSQKGIVIGRGGARLRQVGADARRQIEALLGTKIYLDLHVKIAKDWQRDPKQLRKLGF